MIFRCCRVLLVVVFALTLFYCILCSSSWFADRFSVAVECAAVVLPLPFAVLVLSYFALYTYFHWYVRSVHSSSCCCCCKYVMKRGHKSTNRTSFQSHCPWCNQSVNISYSFLSITFEFQIILFTDKRTVFGFIWFFICREHSLQSTRKFLTSSIKYLFFIEELWSCEVLEFSWSFLEILQTFWSFSSNRGILSWLNFVSAFCAK